MNSGPPLWLLILLPVLDFGLPALLLFLGILLFRKTFKAHRNSNQPVCKKCRYDMRGATSLACPECGFTHKSTAQLYPRQITFYPRLLLAALLCLPGLWLLLFSLYYFPTTYLQNRATRQKITALSPLSQRPRIYVSSETQDIPPAWVSWLAHAASDNQSISFESTQRFLQQANEPATLRTYTPPEILFRNLMSWTWRPSLNYVTYLPLHKVNFLTFSAPSPGIIPAQSLTPDHILMASRLPGLYRISVNASIAVDDQTLAQFAAVPPLKGGIHVDNYTPNPAQAHIWDTAAPIDQLGILIIRPRGPIPPGLFKTIRTSSLYTLKILDPNPASNPPSDQPFLAQGLSQLSVFPSRFELDAGTPAQRSQILDLCSTMPNLNELSLRGMDISSCNLQNLPNLPRLRFLELAFTPDSPVTDQHIHPLTRCHLINLTLRNAPKVKGSFLSSLPPGRWLNLRLHNTGLDINSLLAIKPDTLTGLYLSQTQITPQSLIPFLKNQSKLDRFGYDQPATQPLCEQLAALPSLSGVSLHGVDAQGLLTLLKAPSMRYIDIAFPAMLPPAYPPMQTGPNPPLKGFKIMYTPNGISFYR